MSTIRLDEVERFNRLAVTGCNRTGPMRPPHGVNELRLGLGLERIARRLARPAGALQGLRIAVTHLAPGRLLLASTINRTLRGYRTRTAIVGAERVFRVLPRGTHRRAQFVRPAEMDQAATACGLVRGERCGMACLPVVHRAWWTRNMSVNHIASFGKPSS